MGGRWGGGWDQKNCGHKNVCPKKLLFKKWFEMAIKLVIHFFGTKTLRKNFAKFYFLPKMV